MTYMERQLTEERCNMLTTERSYSTVDKSAWGPGPWQDEPDKIQWVDDATDLDCLIVRGPAGALCGYVGLPPEHPCHGVDYDSVVPDVSADEDGYRYIDVHGGLTYAAGCQEGGDESKSICHVPLPGRPDGVWWFGFDCAHLHDLAPRHAATDRQRGWSSHDHDEYRSVSYVRAEVARLAQQLVTAVVEIPSWKLKD